MPGIDISDVTKVYPGGVTALDALELTIHDGEFFALLGPSGCGKTTLLRTIAGLESATAGTLRIGTRDITDLPPGDRHVAMVFQDYALYPHMTVRDNIAYPLRIKKVGRAERSQRAEAAGDSLSLGGLMDRRPGQLSGGQQQRVALARAVATRPDVFLFDEPLSNLDARLRLEARTFLKKLQRELATTAVFVTHDQSEALALADRMAVMESGVIRQVGTPSELFHHPANLFVAGFIGSTPMNLLPGVVVDGGVDVDGAVFPIVEGTEPGRLDLGREVYYGIRPEYVAIDHTGSIGGTVVITENLGTSYLVTVDLGSTQVRGTVEEGFEPAQGDTVALDADGATGAAVRPRRRHLDRQRGRAMIAFHRRYTLDDRAASVYQYLPFEVPAEASGVTVTLAYDRTTGVVDLGLVAPDRFGGWSGGERSEVTVTPEWATPGYVPGEVGGEWAVVLGLYRVSPGGVEVTVDVDVATRPLPSAAGAGATTAPTAPARPGAAGGARARVAGVRLPQPHRALRRGAGGRGTGGPGRLPWPRRVGGHRPQHGQPSPPPRGRGRPRRRAVAAGPGGHHRPGPRQLLRGDRVDRLPPSHRTRGAPRPTHAGA